MTHPSCWKLIIQWSREEAQKRLASLEMPSISCAMYETIEETDLNDNSLFMSSNGS
jgi:hypothetical protein